MVKFPKGCHWCGGGVKRSTGSLQWGDFRAKVAFKSPTARKIHMVNHFHAIYKGNLLHGSDIQIVTFTGRRKDFDRSSEVSACGYKSFTRSTEK